jgi:murein DD-endopeptidase MepM/ murein hydrolase activator NlpD
MAALHAPVLVGVATMITGIVVVTATGGAGVRPTGGPAAASDIPGPAAAVSLRGLTAALPGPVVAARAPVAAPPAAAAAGRKGWSWPLVPGAPTVVRTFRVGPQNWSPGHRGVDLAAEAGRRVVAAGPGRVGFVGVIAGRGVVTVDHAGGLRTTYEPVTATVAGGDLVVAGQTIGTLQADGSHCGARACLHWGLRNAVRYFDPLLLLRPPHPVLLPDSVSVSEIVVSYSGTKT